MTTLISLPVGSETPFITVEDRKTYYVVIMNSGPDNRLTPDVLTNYVHALTWLQTEKRSEPKPLVTTSAIPKFFSNGLNLELAYETDNFFPDYLFTSYKALLHFPWPTIAYVNGHAFAGGFLLATYHDYRVMNPEKGFLCMNELLFGAHLPFPMLKIIQSKYGTARAQEVFLTAKRYSGPEAHRLEMVDAIGGIPEVETLVGKVAPFAKSPVYGVIRSELYKDIIADCESHLVNEAAIQTLQHNSDLFNESDYAKIETKIRKSKL